MTLKDSQIAMRTPLVFTPLTAEQITSCRDVLMSNGAADLLDMLGVDAA